MHKVKRVLDKLDHYELLKLKQQMQSGDFDFEKELQEKIKEREKQHSKICATCSNDLDPYNSNNYTILFGPEDFKKKASFCGVDCLEYFLMHLKHLKKGGHNEQKIK